MMYKVAAAGALVLAVTISIFMPQANAAEVIITPELVQQIETHCVENQASLNRLHKNDIFQRNIRGDLYRTISDKLMVPLNRRIAASQLDGSQLIAVTADYNDEYDQFYETYIAYDNALTKVLEIDCTKEPVSFYNALVDAREKRAIVDEHNKQLIRNVLEYEKQFKTFQKEYLSEEANS